LSVSSNTSSSSITSAILAILATQFFNLLIKRLNLLITVGILCLIINPFYLQSLAFQLSFLASFIIIFYWPYIKKKIAKSTLMFSFIMQFFMWPVLIVYFSSINLIAIPANVIISPLVELLTVVYFIFIACKTCKLLILADFVSNTIYFVNFIFFTILNFLEKIPGKTIVIKQDKTLIITALLLVQLYLIALITIEKKRIYKKNKYRVLVKWSNYLKV